MNIVTKNISKYLTTNELNKVKIFSLENKKQENDITEWNYLTLINIYKNDKT